VHVVFFSVFTPSTSIHFHIELLLFRCISSISSFQDCSILHSDLGFLSIASPEQQFLKKGGSTIRFHGGHRKAMRADKDAAKPSKLQIIGVCMLVQ